MPERYNIAADVCDRHPREQLALIHEDPDGNVRRVRLGRDPGQRGPLRERAPRSRRGAGRPGGDAAAAEAGDGRRVLRHLEGRRDPALDVGALRRRGDPPPAHRLPTPRAGHQRRQRRADRPLARRARADPRRRAAGDGRLASSRRVDTAADDPAQLYYSSGTTGLAKGILHAHRYILAHQEFTFCHDVQDGEVFHGMGEWAWAAGICPLLGPWRLGAVQAVLERRGGFDPHRQLDFLSRHEVTNVFATPTAIRSMMAIEDAATRYPAALPDRLLGRRAAQPGGDPLVPRAVRRHGARLLRPDRELSAVRELPVHGGPRGFDGQADAGLGRGRSSTRTSDRSGRGSAARSACALGRIPHYPLGYWRQPEDSEEVFGGDWFHTKDAASADADGYFWYEGRADDVIISAGYRIGPFEVESACLEHPAVAEAAAVAWPDERRGNVVKAFVVLAAGHEPSRRARRVDQGVRARPALRLRLSPADRVRRRPPEDAHRQDPPDRAAPPSGE